MSDEREQLKEAVSHGNDARELLENPLIQGFLSRHRERLNAQMRKTKYGDDDDRREIWRKHQTLDWFEMELSRFIRDGDLAEKSLLEMAKGAIRRVM